MDVTCRRWRAAGVEEDEGVMTAMPKVVLTLAVQPEGAAAEGAVANVTACGAGKGEARARGRRRAARRRTRRWCVGCCMADLCSGWWWCRGRRNVSEMLEDRARRRSRAGPVVWLVDVARVPD